MSITINITQAYFTLIQLVKYLFLGHKTNRTQAKLHTGNEIVCTPYENSNMFALECEKRY